MTKDERMLQLKIVLEGIRPPIWRRFLVKDGITFQKLHSIIQTVMGWEDYHKYEFRVGDETITCDEDGLNPAEGVFRQLMDSPNFVKMLEKNAGKGMGAMDVDVVNKMLKDAEKNNPAQKYCMKNKISELILSEGQEFSYLYDFGDGWEHTLIVEKILNSKDFPVCPACLAGERACPPEDCGSIEGYNELMRIRKNKKHPRYKEMIIDWLGEDYDPDLFVVDWVNAALQGKRPRAGWMPTKEQNDEFIPLGKLLKEDSDEAKQIKTIHNHEDDYAAYLEEAEMAIAGFFMDNRNLKDKDVEDSLKNIKKNYLQDLSFFSKDIEKEIMRGLSLALQEKSITHHELKLVVNYLLWCIDNRSWLNDSQGYVRWLPYFLGFYEPDEERKYEERLKKTARRLGVPPDQINAMLNMDEIELSDEEKATTEKESEFFALGEGEKLDFLAKHGLDNPGLVQHHAIELEEKKDFKAIEKLYQVMREASQDFPPFEFMLGLNYLKLKNPQLAKHHMETAIKNLESAPSERIADEERKRLLGSMREEMKKSGIRQAQTK